MIHNNQLDQDLFVEIISKITHLYYAYFHSNENDCTFKFWYAKLEMLFVNRYTAF